MKKPITTTLKEIKKHKPCKDGWEKLLKSLGKTKADNEPLTFSYIAKSNGVDDALWCLRSLGEEYYSKIRLLAADYAERVLHLYEKQYPNDNRVRDCIKIARKFAKGKATQEELAAAAAAAAAAWAAAGAAAAGDAAGAAARAAWAAAAGVAAGAAARAAWAAAAAAAAAWAAAGAAAARAAWAAAAGVAEKELQIKLLIKYFG